MKTMIWKLPLSCVVLSIAQHASAQNAAPNENPVFIMNAWSTPEKCNAGNAIEVRLRYAIAHQSEFLGKCIKTKGYYYGRALFLNLEDMEVTYPSLNRSVASRRVGILAKVEHLDDLIDNNLDHKVEFIGEFTTCAQIATNLGGFFMGSYCHYTGGPTILVASYSR